ncbi:MAG: phage Gp37/Gp68 family protein, partial [Hyphomicrobiales bacterium]|nr:phage Gp37/Gp68 family protein [Hyphomicrobiales bacterium]
KPRMIFVNSTSDLFHENVPDEWIDRIFAVMALSPQHTFQVLTKRAKRMRKYLNRPDHAEQIDRAMDDVAPAHWHRRELQDFANANDVLPNVWLGVSAERQKEADERVPDLLATPAAVRFVSAEPLLGPIDFTNIADNSDADDFTRVNALNGDEGIYLRRIGGLRLDWVIVGGESGKDARPMHPDWARQIRDDCEQAGVPFFFKQWGEWLPGEFGPPPELRWQGNGPIHDANQFPADFDQEPNWDDGLCYCDEAEQAFFYKAGKKRAGRLLDGVEHNGMPQAAEVPAL